MTICPAKQHRWGHWTAAIPGFQRTDAEVLIHPGVMSGIPIDFRPEAQHWERVCAACGSRERVQPTVPRADTGGVS